MKLRTVAIGLVVSVAGLVSPAAVAGEGGGGPYADGADRTARTAMGDPIGRTTGKQPIHRRLTPPKTANKAGPIVGALHSAPAGPGIMRVRCGPELTSPHGVEAQTCVLTDGRTTWGRTYYRNATGAELNSVLTLMGPGWRTVRLICAVEAGDEPKVCETPGMSSRGLTGYSAIAEFAAVERPGEASGGGAGEAPGDPVRAADGPPLLLRSGSESGGNYRDPAGR
ncbi:hypothetical protein ABZ714_20325 [Streptomyces sp. NPDC006798]|uniref:hypothetical protein n=1 Tax=Streptomyces sp. NPDC006798 TaxID=3155462 RepID=UPI0033FEA5E2